MCFGIYVKNLDLVLKYAKLMNIHFPLVASCINAVKNERAERRSRGPKTSSFFVRQAAIYYLLWGYSIKDIGRALGCETFSPALEAYYRYVFMDRRDKDPEFLLERYLNRLVLIDERNGKTVYICPVCGREFDDARMFVKHIADGLRQNSSARSNFYWRIVGGGEDE